ncbi:hypothetical protein [Capnocytophaga sputigena]|jgi:hypothetical protein|uniref:hypothetical protein n=1 Tax=Capnocytophaga sputigena TaxID=1019 RepID=UPI0028D1EAA7|nr:hypothetical protein [Capnocytophaga sputigena]
MIEEKFTPAVMEFPKPDLKMKAEEKNMTTTIDYSVVVPSSERKDFFLQIRASQIQEIREICSNAKENNYLEILLFFASALIGSSVCAFFSDLKISDFWGIINFAIFPCIFVFILTAYFFLRKENNKSLNDIKEQIFKKLPDPKQEK